MDILPGHTGTCHRALAFSDPELERIARRAEQDYAQRFLDHKVVLRIVPIVIDFRARVSDANRRAARFGRKTKDHVGEGVAVRLDVTADFTGDAPELLRDAQADMIVRQRAASEREWIPVRPLEAVESLLREQAGAYLRELARTRV
jgi:hypothetical protein